MKAKLPDDMKAGHEMKVTRLSELKMIASSKIEEGDVTPYQLATLAALLYPNGAAAEEDDRYMLQRALDLIRTAKDTLAIRAARNEAAERQGEVRINFVKAAKFVTSVERADRATRKFERFLKAAFPGKLAEYKRDGVREVEMHGLKQEYAQWLTQPKAKQGRRISDYDGRLRAGGERLLPKKPQKVA